MKETKKHTNKGQITRENAKEMQVKSRESAKRNKKWREYVKALGKMQITMQMPDGTKEQTTWDGAIVVSAYRLAIAGDDKARKFIGLLNGQLDEPTLKIEAKVRKEPDLTPEEAADFIARLKEQI